MPVTARDVASALRLVADTLPPEVAESADLVEMRLAVDPEERAYVGEDV